MSIKRIKFDAASCPIFLQKMTQKRVQLAPQFMRALVRQAKLGASCRVKVLVG